MLQTFKRTDTCHFRSILSLISRFPCLYEWRGTRKMKSDTGNKMSDQLRVEANRRAVLLVFTAAPIQSPPSPEQPATVLLTYESVQWADLYRPPRLWLVHCTPQALLSSGSAPPKGKQRRQLHLSVGEKVERRDENGIIVFGKLVAINVCLEWQIVLLNSFYFDVFSFPLPAPVRAVPLSWDCVRQEEGRDCCSIASCREMEARKLHRSRRASYSV